MMHAGEKRKHKKTKESIDEGRRERENQERTAGTTSKAKYIKEKRQKKRTGGGKKACKSGPLMPTRKTLRIRRNRKDIKNIGGGRPGRASERQSFQGGKGKNQQPLHDICRRTGVRKKKNSKESRQGK